MKHSRNMMINGFIVVSIVITLMTAFILAIVFYYLEKNSSSYKQERGYRIGKLVCFILYIASLCSLGMIDTFLIPLN